MQVTSKKRYAICGVSNRGLNMFIGPLFQTFSDFGEIVAFLDIDPRRFEVCREIYPQAKAIPTYLGEGAFDQMVAETRPDTVIVSSMDSTHATYILKALTKNLDVISEKPMTSTAADAKRVLDAEMKSKGKVTVTFNLRYTPEARRIKELILEGKIGRVTSVDLNWMVDTHHGSSYFMRWNRHRENSGGLSVHKSTHHLDLVSWMVGQGPVEVFAHGALNYYGALAPQNPQKGDGRRCGTCEVREDCAYFRRWNARVAGAAVPDDHLGTVKGGYTGYHTDQCIFDSRIDIEDTYTATIRMDGGTLFAYSVNFSSPYEGLRLALNGTKGRIEWTHYHGLSRIPFPIEEESVVDYFPLFGSGRERINVVQSQGSHGGADPLLQEDLFIGMDTRRGYAIQSNAMAGAQAVALGEGIWRSVKEHRLVTMKELLGF